MNNIRQRMISNAQNSIKSNEILAQNGDLSWIFVDKELDSEGVISDKLQKFDSEKGLDEGKVNKVNI